MTRSRQNRPLPHRYATNTEAPGAMDRSSHVCADASGEAVVVWAAVCRLHKMMTGRRLSRRGRGSMTIFDRTMRLLERTLDLRSTRQRVIASNIANEETPRYRATDLKFTDALAHANRGRCP